MTKVHPYIIIFLVALVVAGIAFGLGYWNGNSGKNDYA